MSDDLGGDRRKRSTAQRISASLYSLLRGKTFDDISVTEICEEAGVARKTFYRNFTSKEDVVGASMDEMFSQLKTSHDLLISDVRSLYLFCYEWLNAHADVAEAFCDRGLFGTITQKIRECVEAALSDTAHNSVTFEPTLAAYYLDFISAGIATVFRGWVVGGRKQSPETMSQLTERLLSGVIT